MSMLRVRFRPLALEIDGDGLMTAIDWPNIRRLAGDRGGAPLGTLWSLNARPLPRPDAYRPSAGAQRPPSGVSFVVLLPNTKSRVRMAGGIAVPSIHC